MSAYISFVRRSKRHSDYYLHGAGKLTKPIKHLCGVVSLSSFSCNSLVTEVMADDRLCRNADHVDTIVAEEETYVHEISPYV